ncbi:MAG TPA: WecB/TagA/CpsF family glycosyltransferase [Candidatus Polarisedimenticolia bacterium]|jgi:N-acetylglucosaminyldiphosphoundecaprenol N-acetyl-beta-D-mannosaminyltransferase|nr:WecB/TagA/CpsF family glycosyltransferase [Candidatus Polarisedimenticolia bacterium]
MNLGVPALTPQRRLGERKKQLDLLGVRFDRLSREQALEALEAEFGRREHRKVYIVNAHTLNLAWKDPYYRRVLNEADFLLNDGSGVGLAARLRGQSFPANLVGTDLVPLLCARAVARGSGVFLLGGRAGVPERAANRLQDYVPGLQVCGYRHGYFSRSETGDLIQQINNSKASILLVAFGNPLQEIWIHENAPKIHCDLSIGVGGLFDHLAGRLRRAPIWMRRAGIEWVHILVNQPHKWKRYLLGNPLFVIRAIGNRLGWGP